MSSEGAVRMMGAQRLLLEGTGNAKARRSSSPSSQGCTVIHGLEMRRELCMCSEGAVWTVDAERDGT